MYTAIFIMGDTVQACSDAILSATTPSERDSGYGRERVEDIEVVTEWKWVTIQWS